MPPSLDNDLVETIVTGVMNRLRSGSVSTLPKSDGITESKSSSSETITIPDRVVTAAVLADRLGNARCAQFAANAVLTPTARDYLQKHGVSWSHASGAEPNETTSALAILVSDAPLVQRVLASVLPSARCELLGCVDDAAKLAIAEMARGQYPITLIFTRKTYRAACLANRQSAVRAVPVREAAEVATIAAQLRSNTWCLDPSGLGKFELRNTVKAIVATTAQHPIN